jgi:alpha-D-ribose 1-methylphosphonate 5-triphosphate synthase subunit PhnG
MSNASSTASAGAVLVEERRHVMALAARATTAELEGAVRALHDGPVDEVRRPETGLVMVRGRTGGDGAPFNLGEATVTRAAVRLPTGETGFSYLLGRDARRARHAAVLDALVQALGPANVLGQLKGVEARVRSEDEMSSRQAAATRVDFFTMVRGED